jgi:hypothetical protein
MHRQYQHAHFGQGLAQAAHDFDAVEVWHGNVGDHDVGPRRQRLLDRFQSVGGLRDDLYTGRALQEVDQ